MAKTDYKSVDQYIAAQPEAARAVLQRVRDLVKRAVPDAEELISYQIPAYRHEGGYFSLYLGMESALFALSRDRSPRRGPQGRHRAPSRQQEHHPLQAL